MPVTERRPRARAKRARTASAIQPQKKKPSRSRPILIATDGSEPAIAALRIARAMADRGDWAPQVLTVCEPLPVSVAGFALPVPTTSDELTVTNSVIQAVRRQLRRYGGASWKLSVEFGRAASLIARVAREASSELIVLGLGRHNAVARLLGAETAARVVRHTDLPVLAVHPMARHLPKIAVAAMDFGDSSVRAAHEACELLEPPARLHLVHVKWGYNVTALRDAEWERAYTFGVEHGFNRVRKELPKRAGIEVTTEFLHGGVIRSLVERARTLGADLIALGSHSQTVVDRLVIGSTPAEALRQAPCSVLIAPPADNQT